MRSDIRGVPIREFYRWPDVDNELAKEMYFSVLERAEKVDIELQNLRTEQKQASGKEFDLLLNRTYDAMSRYMTLMYAAGIMLQLADKEVDS